MKVTDFKDEAAIKLLADILDPTAAIFGDAKVKTVLAAVENGTFTRAQAISEVLRLHPKEIMAIMAALEGKKPEEFHCNILTLPAKIIELTEDEELMVFFKSQVEEMMEKEPSGSPMENIEEPETSNTF